MPIRSNRFQKLVHMLERQLSGKANVRQSVELADRDTGENREVDVVIDIQSGHQQLRIGLEVTSGRGGTPWVESMIGKHQLGGLSDRLILVAEDGFAGAAVDKARMHGVDVVSLEEAESLDWTTIVGRYEQLWFARVNLRPETTSLTIEASPDSQAEVVVSPETEILSADGSRRTTLIQLVHQYLRRAQILKQVYDREDREKLSSFKLDGTPDEECFVIDSKGHKRKLTKLHVKGSLDFMISPFDVKSSTYRGVAISYGEFEFDGKKALAAIVEEPDSGPRVSINLSDSENDPGEVVDFDTPIDPEDEDVRRKT